MYAVYHGPKGLKRDRRARARAHARCSPRGLDEARAASCGTTQFFDTRRASTASAAQVGAWLAAAEAKRINLRRIDERTRRHRARRDDARAEDVARPSSTCSRRRDARVSDAAPRGAGRRRRIPRTLCAHERVPHAPGLQHAPLRDGDAALHAPARGARSVAHALDDPARLLHDEAERDRGDDADDLAGVRPAAPVRAAPRRPRLRADLQELESDAAEITGFAGVSLQPNAGSQGEYAGLLVIRAYHESRGQGAPQRLPDPVVRARHQPGLRGDGRLPRRRRRSATTSGNVDLADLRGARRTSTRDGARGADGHLPVDARRVRGGDQGDLRRSSTSTAARCTWTAPT